MAHHSPFSPTPRLRGFLGLDGIWLAPFVSANIYDEYRLGKSILKSIKSNREAGKTYAWIADHLNELGVTTVNGSRWFPITVQRCAVRLSCGNTLG